MAKTEKVKTKKDTAPEVNADVAASAAVPTVLTERAKVRSQKMRIAARALSVIIADIEATWKPLPFPAGPHIKALRDISEITIENIRSVKEHIAALLPFLVRWTNTEKSKSVRRELRQAVLNADAARKA